MHPGPHPARDTGMWGDTRPPSEPRLWDEQKPRDSRESQRPVLRPVPDLPEPTLRIDTSSFFEPEHPRSRSRRSQEMPQVVQPALFHPARAEMEQPALVQATATGGPGGGPGGLGSRIDPPGMSSSNQPPHGPPEPPRMPEPAYPTAPGFAPESFPTQHSQPPSGPQSGRPDRPAFPPPEPFDESKQGRFGKKGRKADNPAAGAANSPPSPTSPVPAAAQERKKEKVKKEKKGGLFGPLKGAPKAAATPPPPPVPSRPATPPKPRFAAPFNYTPPNASPPAAKPPTTYPTASSPAQPNRPWGPPASFSPPPAPSFSSWGPPNPANQAPPPPEPQRPEPASAPSEPFAPATPNFPNGNGNGYRTPDPADSPWSFGFNADEGNSPAGGPSVDPVLPAFIELSMFQDPTSADDIAAEQEADEQHDRASEDSGAEEGWLSKDAWPAPSEAGTGGKHDPWPMDRQPAEETQLLEQHWPQETPETDEAAGRDWTSADTPWPGETRRPAEPTWANEPPAAESLSVPRERKAPAAEPQPEPTRWGDEAWQNEARQPEPQPPRWPQEPEPPVEDVWGREVRTQPAERPAVDPWEAARPAAEYPDDPWVQARQASRPEPPAPREPEVEAVRTPEAPPTREHRGPALGEVPTSEPASSGPRLFVDDDDDWRPLSLDVNLDEPAPRIDPVAEAAARLRAAETAIKVDNGLAYVLVDDEGRAVLK